MTKPLEQALSAFIDDWNAGRGPQLDEHLQSVADRDRAELAAAVATFMRIRRDAGLRSMSPERSWTPIRRWPSRASGCWVPSCPSSCVSIGPQRQLSVRDVARRVGAALGLSGREERIESYLERLEHAELDGRRLSRRLLDALASVLGADCDALERASLRGLAPSGALFRMADDRDAGQVLDQLEAVADALYAAAPPAADEIDDLFLGGR